MYMNNSWSSHSVISFIALFVALYSFFWVVYYTTEPKSTKNTLGLVDKRLISWYAFVTAVGAIIFFFMLSWIWTRCRSACVDPCVQAIPLVAPCAAPCLPCPPQPDCRDCRPPILKLCDAVETCKPTDPCAAASRGTVIVATVGAPALGSSTTNWGANPMMMLNGSTSPMMMSNGSTSPMMMSNGSTSPMGSTSPVAALRSPFAA